MINKNNILLPDGLKDLLIEEASDESELVKSLLGSFQSSGYEIVKPPLIEHEDSILNNVFSFGKVIFRLVLVKVREGFTFFGALLGLKAFMPISASSNMQSRNLTLNKFCTSKSCSQRWAISLDFAAPRWSRSAIVVFPGGMSLEESIVSEFSTP